jgi:hypothetical protein
LFDAQPDGKVFQGRDMTPCASDQVGVSRRHILQILSALGFSGAVAESLAAQAAPVVSAGAIGSAATLLSGTFDEPRLAVARTALQRNLEQFQAVRELDLPDGLEPPVIFRPRRS